MSTKTLLQLVALALACLAVAVITACGGSSKGGSAGASAHAAASSALANPTVSADLTDAESRLSANLSKEIAKTPLHPVKAVEAAVHDTWPAGDAAAIES